MDIKLLEEAPYYSDVETDILRNKEIFNFPLPKIIEEDNFDETYTDEEHIETQSEPIELIQAAREISRLRIYERIRKKSTRLQDYYTY